MSDSLTIKLPLAVHAEDYHDFSYISQILAQVSGVKVRVDEIGSTQNGQYVGICYIGAKPSPEAIEAALKERNITLHDEDAVVSSGPKL